jgi:hypothetical protein
LFKDEIDLSPLADPPVMESGSERHPCGLLRDLIDDERLDERASCRRDPGSQTVRVNTDQMSGEAGIGDVELGPTNRPGHKIPGPRRNLTDIEPGHV